MELKILIQDKDKIDVNKTLKFIQKCNNRKFVLIYSSLKDEIMRLNFFSKLLEESSEELLGCGVSSFITNTGYYSNHLAVCVFSGEFEVEIHNTPIEYENIEETVNRINEKISGHELSILHSANQFKDNYVLDKILRRVQEKNPKTQIVGGVTSPGMSVATKEGIFNDNIAYILIKKAEFNFKIESGFGIDEHSTHEFKITKSDEDAVYEINGRNAAKEYQKIQHVRDYMYNQMMNMVSREDAINLPQYFQKANEILFDAISKAYKDLLANKTRNDLLNLFVVTQIEEKKLRVNKWWPEGTTLKKTVTEPEKQLAVYDRLVRKHRKGEAMILIDCAMRLFYYNYQTDDAYNRLKKIKYPFIAPQVYGEIGNYTPYHPKENIIHNCVIKALVFK